MLDRLAKLFRGGSSNAQPEMSIEDTSDAEICAEMDKLQNEMKSVLQRFHRQWFYQIAMRIGAQWLHYHPEGYMILPDNNEGRARIVMNRILATHQTKLGKLVRPDPWFEARADNSSYISRRRARKGNQIAQYVYNEQRMKRKIKSLGSWTLDIGTCFLYPFWDSSLGEDVVEFKQHAGAVDHKGEAMTEMGALLGFKVDNEGYVLDESGNRIVSRQYKTGDVRIDVIPAFDITPYTIKHDGGYKGLIYTSEHDTKDLQKAFPEFAEYIKPEKTDTDRMRYYKQIQGIVSSESYTTTDKDSAVDKTFVRQLFEEPSEAYPCGRHFVRISNKIVHKGKLPYKHKRIPMIKFIDIENSGQPFGMATVQNLIPPQKTFNRAWSQLVENFETHANIKWKVTNNANLEKDALDDSSDEVIIYQQGANVEQVTPAAMPQYVTNILSSMLPQAFMDISGQHDVTMGEAPGEVRSGYGLEQLQRSDDIRNAPTHADFSAGLQELGEQVLSLYEEHLTEGKSRTFTIKGTGKEFTVTTEDLKDLWKSVSSTAGTMLNSDMHVSKEQIMELWKNGLFGDPEDPKVRKKVQEMYEFGNLDALFEYVDQDTDWAEEENDILMSNDVSQFKPFETADPTKIQLDEAGQPMKVMTLPANRWEDHKIHINVHDSLRKTREYRELPQEKKDSVDAHVDWHVDLMVQEAPPPQPGAEEEQKSGTAQVGAIPPIAGGPPPAPPVVAPPGPMPAQEGEATMPPEAALSNQPGLM